MDAICSPSNQQTRLGGHSWAAKEQQYLGKLKTLAPPRSERATYARFEGTFQIVINGFSSNDPGARVTGATARAVMENENLRRKLHAPGCGLRDASP
jgi:hypothetical protein